MKIGLIGCGNIGTELAELIDKNNLNLFAVNDIDKQNIDNLMSKIKQKPKTLTFEKLIKKSDLIIEAANVEIAKKLIKSTLNKKKKIIILSSGGLIEENEILAKTNSEIYLPSGAIAGLDGIKSAAIDKIDSITLTTTKSPKSLEGAPYIVNNKISLKLKKKKIIFNGNMKEAVQGFPKNVNVAASLFLASRFGDIKVQIIADPKAKTNTHEILVKGSFGKLNISVENLPSKNPKTSYLAILSAKRTIINIISNLKIGN